MAPSVRGVRWSWFWWPAVVVYGLFLLYPIVLAVYGSLFAWSGVGERWSFVGLQQYGALGRDSIFWHSLLHNLVLVAASVGVQVPLAFGFAWLLSRGWRGQGVLRALFFAPMLMPTVAIALLWVSIYDPHFGLLNGLVRLLTGRPWEWGWLGEERTALGAVVAATCWRYVGFHMVLFLAGIEGVPREYEEAARLDGASESQIVRHILLPLLWPVTRVVLTLALIGSLKYFDIIYVMTGGDGPYPHATELVATYMYKLAFQEWRMGYGCTVAVCLLGLTLLGGGGFWLWARWRGEG